MEMPRWQSTKAFCRIPYLGSVSIVWRFDSPKIQLKLTLTDTGGAVLTLTSQTDTGDLRTIEPSGYRADTVICCHLGLGDSDCCC